MRQINIGEAKTHLSSLVDAAAKGEAFVISKAGKPLVKVVPVDDVKKPELNDPVKRIGFMVGMIDEVPDNFDRLYEDEIAKMFGVD